MISDQDIDFMEQRGFGNEIGFGSRPALLVVDLITGFTDPESPLGSNLDIVVSNTTDLINVARSSETPILFTSVAYDEADLGDAGLWRLKQTGVRELTSGSAAVELDHRLSRRESEPLIFKKYASAFFGTDLISRLITRSVDTLVIAGCTTSGCVRATAVDALQLGMRPIVVADAVGDRLASAHEQSLFDLQAKYADVRTSADVMTAIEQSPQ